MERFVAVDTCAVSPLRLAIKPARGAACLPAGAGATGRLVKEMKA